MGDPNSTKIRISIVRFRRRDLFIEGNLEQSMLIDCKQVCRFKAPLSIWSPELVIPACCQWPEKLSVMLFKKLSLLRHAAKLDIPLFVSLKLDELRKRWWLRWSHEIYRIYLILMVCKQERVFNLLQRKENPWSVMSHLEWMIEFGKVTNLLFKLFEYEREILKKSESFQAFTKAR